MGRDIITVISKEVHEYWHMRGAKSPWRGHIMAVILFSLWPAMSGAALLGSPWCALIWTWMVTIMIAPLVADSFAGERERHTLDTLLSSRLSDESIVFGKLISSSLCSWATGMLSLPVALLLANVISPHHGVIHLHPSVWITAPVSALCCAFMFAGLNSALVVKAVTVKQATQVSGYGNILVILLPTIAIRFVDEKVMQKFLIQMQHLNPVTIFTVLSAAAIVIGVFGGLIGLWRFKTLRRDGV